MKRSILAYVLGFMIAFAPVSASAMKPISNRALKFLTGQAGISDVVEQTKVYISAITNGRTSDIIQVHWVGGVTDVLSYTGVDDIDVMVHPSLWGTTNSNMFLASSHGGTSAESQNLTGVTNKYVNTFNPETGVEDLFITQYMTITPSRCPILSNMLAYNNRTFNRDLFGTDAVGIVINMPTFEIHATAVRYEVVLLNPPDSLNSDKKYLTFSRGPITQATLAGNIEVTTHEEP